MSWFPKHRCYERVSIWKLYTKTMSKVVMYIIISVATVIGGWLPTLFGASMLDMWSILGSVVGGFIGIFVYWKLRQAGYLE